MSFEAITTVYSCFSPSALVSVICICLGYPLAESARRELR
jgi:hypothetical protein